MAPAGRPHAARRHRAQPGRRRHLSLRRRHRAHRHAPALRRADQGAARDARSSGGSRRRVRQRRPRAAAQPGVPAHVEARARGARPASARRSGDRLGAGAARRQYRVAEFARRGDGDRQPRADRRAHRTARRHDDRHDGDAAARRRDACYFPRRLRQRQRRARADREERGIGDRRRHQDRLRASRILRAALAAHQHHRLRAFPRRPGLRRAQRQAARIPRLHHRLDQRAAWR